MSKKECVNWILTTVLMLILILCAFGCLDPRQTFHKPGTYDCCKIMWHDPNQE